MLEVPQYVVNALAGVIMAALGWFARMLWDDLRQLEKEHAKLREHIAENYAKKNDVRDAVTSFQSQVESLSRDVKEGFERLFDKLDGKQDKS